MKTSFFVPAMLMASLLVPLVFPGPGRADEAGAATQPTTQPMVSSAPTRFYGVVSAVDIAKNTFTIDDQTYTVTGETQMTKDSKSATLADAVVGEPARGSYTTTADGKHEVTKVRFGKKSGGKGGKHKHSSEQSGASTQPADQ